MKNDFIDVIQKCIYVDYILSTLMDSHYKNYSNVLSTIKEENQRNIKIMIYLYESCHQDTISLKNIKPLKLCKVDNNYIITLIESILQIINGLETLRKVSSNHLYQQLLNSLKTSYFNFVSLINCFFPNCISLNTTLREQDFHLVHFSKLNSDGFNLDNTNSKILKFEDISYEAIRNTSIEAINIFFNYILNDNLITEEHYEIFFKNNPENKFYQLFFKSQDRIFKIRVWEKNLNVFYLYQSILDSVKVVPSMTKDEAKTYAESYLSDKLDESYEILKFDDNYLNVYSYMNLPEYYKFKYNIPDTNIKPNYNKSLYITIDSIHLIISELLFL